MYLPLVLMIAMCVGAAQLLLCFRARRLWVKLLPLILALGADALCWAVYFTSVFSHIYGGDFAAYIYGVLLAMFAVVDILSWGVYGIIRAVRRRNGTLR